MLTEDTITMIFKGKYGVRFKLAINEETIEQISNCKYLGCEISIINAQEDSVTCTLGA
jgi:hypothetical protein